MSTRWTLKDIQEKGLRIIDTTKQNHENPVELTSKQKYEALGRMKDRKMNKTEAAYFKYLEVQKQFGEILWFEYEPMNLRLADKCFYKVDFMVLTKEMQLEVHEVKGGWQWRDDALVKIKTAATKFPFKFIAVSLIKGKWEVRKF